MPPTKADHDTLAPPDIDRIAVAVESLSRAYHAATLYGADHPSFVEAAQDAAKAAAAALAGGGAVTIGVTRDVFLVDDTALPFEEDLVPLALLLHGMDVAGIELRSGVTAADLAALVEIVVQGRRSGRKAGDVLPEIRARTGGRVRVIPLDFSGVQVAGGRARDSGESLRFSWAFLVRSLATGRALGGLEAETLARHVRRAARGGDEQRLHELRQGLRLAAGAARSARGGEERTQRQRLREFVEALGPSVRGDLLAHGRSRLEQWMTTAADLADVWPAPEVLEAIERIDDTGRVPSRAALQLFSRLATMVADDHQHCDQLAELSRRWSASPQADGDSARLLGSLSELLHARHREDDFFAADYGARLEQIATEAAPRMHTVGLDDLLHPGCVSVRAAEITVRLARDHGEPLAALPRVFAQLDRSNDVLCENGYVETVAEAIRVARHCEQSGEGEADGAPAATQYLKRIATPETLQRLLSSAGRHEKLPAATAALRLLGDRALGPLLELLSETSLPAPARRAALEAAAAGDPAPLASQLTALLRRKPAAVERLAPLIAGFPRTWALGVAEPLLDEAERAVRRAACRALTLSDSPWPSALLRRTAGDPDPAVREIALEQAARQDDEAGVAVLALTLTEKLDDRAPAALLDRALDGLLASGDPTRVAWMALALRALAVNPRAIKRGLPRRLAAALRPHASEPVVRWALLRWRFAPLRLVCGVAARFRAGEDGRR